MTMQHLTFLLFLVTTLSACASTATKEQHRMWLKYEAGHHETIAKELPETVHYHFHEFDSFVVSGTTDEIERLKAHPRILQVEKDVIRYRFGGRKTRRRRNQLRWPDQATSYAFPMIQADLLHAYGLTGENITMCVPDSGVDVTHEDLDASRISGDNLSANLMWDIDFSGHGTAIAGIWGAQDNDIGLIGIAPKVKIHSIDIFEDQDFIVYVSASVEALRLCRDAGAKVISLSYGGPETSVVEFDMINDMYENYGILTIASAGNSGDSTLFYPAAYRQVISVGSVDELERPSDFSTGNAMVDIVAPGDNVWTTIPQNPECSFCEDLATSTYGPLSGTSFSCPQVAGIAALLWSEDTSVGVEYIYNALLASARDLADPGRDELTGLGLLQGAAAYDVLHATLNGTQAVAFKGGTCPQGYFGVRVAMLTDPFSLEETYWEIVRNSDNYTAIARSGLVGNTQHISNACLPDDCYSFHAYDSGGDGICCVTGQGTLEVSIDGKVVLDDEFTTDSTSVDFGGECTVFPVEQKDPCTNFQMTLRTDEYPEEITILLESVTGETWWSDELFLDATVDYSFLECLDPALCYTFTMFDEFDYLFSPGALELKFGEDVIFSGLPEFELRYSITFGDGCETNPPTAPPTPAITEPPTLSPNAIVPETPVDSATGGISNETVVSIIDAILQGVAAREAEINP